MMTVKQLVMVLSITYLITAGNECVLWRISPVFLPFNLLHRLYDKIHKIFK